MEHEWDINPRLYEGIRNVDYCGVTGLVDVVKKISEGGIGKRNQEASTQNLPEAFSTSSEGSVPQPLDSVGHLHATASFVGKVELLHVREYNRKPALLKKLF